MLIYSDRDLGKWIENLRRKEMISQLRHICSQKVHECIMYSELVKTAEGFPLAALYMETLLIKSSIFDDQMEYQAFSGVCRMESLLVFRETIRVSTADIMKPSRDDDEAAMTLCGQTHRLQRRHEPELVKTHRHHAAEAAS